MELEMGLLCFPSTIFHQGSKPTGQGSISCLVVTVALLHLQTHNMGTWK